jgi:hypothetical protein
MLDTPEMNMTLDTPDLRDSQWIPTNSPQARTELQATTCKLQQCSHGKLLKQNAENVQRVHIQIIITQVPRDGQ